MGRVLAIDYGSKRVGVAVTDPLKMIASPLDTIANDQIFKFLETYCQKESVETLVVGMPKNLQNEDTQSTAGVRDFVEKLKVKFPQLPVKLIDERFTSKMALQAMIAGGSKKKDRKEKAGNIDKVSATIILQSYLDQMI
ncbi:Holliday junction resolvase RuvX [Penaeicola halotolerans]|uniref:Holliday junction resolvase RuvX n=1 Tax=Penaeicola halotolerans TaxID=2793196 RepID=UPI001CF8C301|nr:Holliday junction resolvase RuvX [Penaeicola halotolerans]